MNDSINYGWPYVCGGNTSQLYDSSAEQVTIKNLLWRNVPTSHAMHRASPHLKCFALIMLVIILKQTCNLSSASKALPIKCLPQSFYRRMQRFFAGQYFDYRQISQLIFNMFSFDQVQLTLDRTNWKWGKRNINILMLAIVYRGIAIPILWTLLNKRGNSDTKERIALIQRFIAIFGKDRIVNVFADREFIGEQWFTWLIEQDINFCIRVKKTSLSPII